MAQAHVAGAPAANEVDAEDPPPRGAQRPGVEGLADLDLQTGLLAHLAHQRLLPALARFHTSPRKILLEIGRDAETARRIGLEQEQQAAVLEDAAFYRNALPRPRRRGLIEPISIILRVPHGRLLE